MNDYITGLLMKRFDYDEETFSVTERTKEIGIRKAIGAGRGVIMLQFQIEVLVVSLMGCVIGLLLSWLTLELITALVGNITFSGMVTFSMTPGVAGVAIGFSLAIGMLFGLYPANKAARKPPVEALRYSG